MKILYLKLVGLLAFPIVLYFVPLDWLCKQHSICLIKNIFGVECFGCGITRAILAAIQLDFSAAYQFNRLVVLVLPLLIYVWLKMVINSIDQLRNPHGEA